MCEWYHDENLTDDFRCILLIEHVRDRVFLSRIPSLLGIDLSAIHNLKNDHRTIERELERLRAASERLVVGEAVAEVFGEIEFLRHVSRLRVGGASEAYNEVAWHPLRWS